MRLSGYERETVINYNQSDTEASVYTYAPKLIRRLQMLSEQFPDRFRMEKTWPFGAVTYVIPKKYVAIRKPVSDTQREALRESAISGQRKPPNRSKHSETDTRNLSGGESIHPPRSPAPNGADSPSENP